MNEFEKIKLELINAGHDPDLIDRTIDAAQGLRSILDDAPTPPDLDLKDVFLDEA